MRPMVRTLDRALRRRLGFAMRPYHNPMGRFTEFWEEVYGWLMDQAELSGVLNTLYEMHLSILSVAVVEDEEIPNS